MDFVLLIKNPIVYANDILSACFSLINKNFQKTGLKLKSAIKTTKIATLDKVVILGKLGELDTQNTQKVKKSLKAYFGL